ncbi:GntR family transcriptional regulator [Ureibacillus xyleni]|uniref:GntR family transcriptional regulator n=1 Tax=Ureibacillus xyleni TaxID=614648 RepID=A0A285S2M4_9BACL|nr:GntR family transcriptional regulator [Ureibacillus xyleni]SOB99328.1 GntR family transcriptional regulator [Ureibacillus xyleni]
MNKYVQKNTIDRNSPIPLYKQIKAILIEELQASDGQTNKPFSTEQELVQRFHVSRAPVRQALKELADEGYVYRERAKGTFPVHELPVRPPGLELGGLVGFLREQGMDCSSTILGVERVYRPEEVSTSQGLNSEVKDLKVSRLIMLKDTYLVWTQTYLTISKDFQPTIQALEEAESVFVLLERELGIIISRGEHQIYASGASMDDAQYLEVNIGDPVLVIETKLYTRNDQLIGFRRAVHRADDYKFSFTVNR